MGRRMNDSERVIGDAALLFLQRSIGCECKCSLIRINGEKSKINLAEIRLEVCNKEPLCGTPSRPTKRARRGERESERQRERKKHKEERHKQHAETKGPLFFHRHPQPVPSLAFISLSKL